MRSRAVTSARSCWSAISRIASSRSTAAWRRR
jgi:hypothetical protein